MDPESLGLLRLLDQDEISQLMEYIKSNGIETSVTNAATKNLHETLKEIIKGVKIYECKIPNYFVRIRDACSTSKASYGTMAGLISSSSIGSTNNSKCF